jgi:hypothetical protein
MSEIRYSVSLEDVLGLEFSCKKCSARLTLNSATNNNAFPDSCPQCNEAWFKPAGVADPRRQAAWGFISALERATYDLPSSPSANFSLAVRSLPK